MRAADAARVQPGVVRTGDVEGDELVLTAAAADVDAVPIGVDERPRPARAVVFLAVMQDPAPLAPPTAARASSSEIPAPARSMSPADRDSDLRATLLDQARQLRLRALGLAVALEVGLGVLVRGQIWIEWDRCAVDVQRV